METKDMTSGLLDTINIHGIDVELRKWQGSSGSVFNAYAKIPNSRFIKLPEGDCSFREGDTFGTDTAHTYMNKYTDEHKILTSIRMISSLIEHCLDVLIIEE